MDEVKCEQIGMLSGGKWDKCHDLCRRVYSPNGLSPTLSTMSGGNQSPKIVEPVAFDEQNNCLRQDGCVGTLTTDGSSPKHNNRIIEPQIAAMRGRNPNNSGDRTAGAPTEQRLEIGNRETSNTLTTITKDNLVVEPVWNNDLGCFVDAETSEMLVGDYERLEPRKPNYRIRKLTPRECFRLMGVKREDYEAVAERQSDSGLYHLAGDSIVTACLMAIFGELLQIDYNTKIKELTEELRDVD